MLAVGIDHERIETVVARAVHQPPEPLRIEIGIEPRAHVRHAEIRQLSLDHSHACGHLSHVYCADADGRSEDAASLATLSRTVIPRRIVASAHRILSQAPSSFSPFHRGATPPGPSQ